MVLLSVNAGSSSLKVAVFNDARSETPSESLSIEGIGSAHAALVPNGEFGNKGTEHSKIKNFDEAAEHAKAWLSEKMGIQPKDIQAIGHRVVHGGARYHSAALVDNDLLSYLRAITPLAPNHTPATVTSIEAFLDAYPTAPQVACFDTSFFHTIPKVAKYFALPLDLQRRHKIRRYGFHGLVYQSLLESFRRHEGETAVKGRIIMAHLGNGVSVCACHNGKPIDMSMGFTPVSGTMMSTRIGDVEPGLVTYLQQGVGLSVDEVSNLMSHRAGLLGVSGLTADMYSLIHKQKDNPDVAFALDLFTYKLRKTIGGMAAALGGVDSIIFSGGIGERSDEIRARICSTFGYLGVTLDKERNAHNERLISADSSSVGVHVIQAREDYSIVTQMLEVINREGNK